MDNKTPTLEGQYLSSVTAQCKHYKSLADQAMSVTPEDLWSFTPPGISNSLTVLVQHLSGHMLSRWTDFLTTDGEKGWRKRTEEFEDHGLSRLDLEEIWNKGCNCMFQALTSLTPDNLRSQISVRGEMIPVIDAINRNIVHYTYHIGQMVYLAKMLRGHIQPE